MKGNQLYRFMELFQKFVQLYVKKNCNTEFMLPNYEDIEIYQIQEWIEDRYMIFLKCRNKFYRVYELTDMTVEVDTCSIPLNFYGYDLSQGFLQEAKIDYQAKQEVI